MAEGKDKAARELMSLQPGSLLNLYRLYPDYISKPEYYFDIHDGSVFQKGVTWQGVVYQPMGIEAEGFETSANGRLNRPKMRISNKDYFVTNLAENNDDFKNAKVIRKRVFLKFLDDINFDGGNPFGDPDPTAELFNEEYLVSQKSQENKTFVEFELTSPLDLDEFEVNNRRIFSKYCYWKYRGEGCGYQGPPIQKADGKPFVDGQGENLGVIGGDELSFEYEDPNDEYDAVRSYLKGEIAFKKNNRVTVADPQGIEDPKPLLTYYIAKQNISGFDPEKNPKFWERDGCNKKISSCKLRFSEPFDRRIFFPNREILHQNYGFTGSYEEDRQNGLILRRPFLNDGLDTEQLISEIDYGQSADYEKEPVDIINYYSFDSVSADNISQALDGSQDFTLMMVLKIGPQDILEKDQGILQTTWNLYDGLRLAFQDAVDPGRGIGMYFTTKDSNGNYIDRNEIISGPENLNIYPGAGGIELPMFIENNSGHIKTYFPTLTANGYENPTFDLDLNATNEEWVIDYHELGLGIMPSRFDDGDKIIATNPSYNYRAYYYSNLNLDDTTGPFYSDFSGTYDLLTTTLGYPSPRDSNGNYLRPYLDGLGDDILPEQNEYAVYSGVDNTDSFIYFSKEFAGWVFAKNDYGTDSALNDKYIVNYTGLHDLANLTDPGDYFSFGDNHIMEYDIAQADRRGNFVLNPSGYPFFSNGNSGVKSSVFTGNVDFDGGLENPYSGQQFKRFNATSHKYNIVPQKYLWQEPVGMKIGATAIWNRTLTEKQRSGLFFTNELGQINAKPLSLFDEDDVLKGESLIGYWDTSLCKEFPPEYESRKVPIYCEDVDPPDPPTNCPFTLDGTVEFFLFYNRCDENGNAAPFASNGGLPISVSIDECLDYDGQDTVPSDPFDPNSPLVSYNRYKSLPDGNGVEASIFIDVNFFSGGWVWKLQIQAEVDYPDEPADLCDGEVWNPNNDEKLNLSTTLSLTNPPPGNQQSGDEFGDYGDEDPTSVTFAIAPLPPANLNAPAAPDIGFAYPSLIPPDGYYLCGFDTKVVIVSPAPLKLVCDSSKKFAPEQSNYTIWSTNMFYDICSTQKSNIKNQYVTIQEENYNLPFGGFPGTDPFQFRTKL